MAAKMIQDNASGTAGYEQAQAVQLTQDLPLSPRLYAPAGLRVIHVILAEWLAAGIDQLYLILGKAEMQPLHRRKGQRDAVRGSVDADLLRIEVLHVQAIFAVRPAGEQHLALVPCKPPPVGSLLEGRGHRIFQQGKFPRLLQAVQAVHRTRLPAAARKQQQAAQQRRECPEGCRTNIHY